MIIILEFCDFGDLKDQIAFCKKQNIVIAERYIVCYLVQNLFALKHAHDRKFFHQDLKPENIFVNGKGEIKLGDLGISKVLASTTG